MTEKKEKCMISENNPKIRSVIQALREFVKALVDMERKGVAEKTGTGEITGLWYRAKYGYHAKLGIEREDFSRSYRKPQSSKLKIKKESVEIVDKSNTISLLVNLPAIKEENLKVKIDGNILKVIASVGENKVERDIAIKEFGVQKALLRNGILELELDKNIISGG